MPPRVWGMSGHYTPATAGRFFKKCQKMPKNRSWGILPKEKCCSVWDQQNFFLSEINFICMNFIRLQGLADETVSGRNNGLPTCYVEFPPRPKTGFSYFFWIFWEILKKIFPQISKELTEANFCPI